MKGNQPKDGAKKKQIPKGYIKFVVKEKQGFKKKITN